MEKSLNNKSLVIIGRDTTRAEAALVSRGTVHAFFRMSSLFTPSCSLLVEITMMGNQVTTTFSTSY